MEDLEGVVEDGFGEGVPEVVDGGEVLEGDELASEGFFWGGDFLEVLEFGDVDVGPADFVFLGEFVAADVGEVVEDSSGFFFGFSSGGLEGGFVGFNSSAGDAPASIGDVGDEDLVVLVGKDEGGEGVDGGSEWGREEFHGLTTIFADGETHC